MSLLVGWVPNCDTLHALIREHRDAHKVPLNLEHRLMLAMAPDYDHLPLVNKVSETRGWRGAGRGGGGVGVFVWFAFFLGFFSLLRNDMCLLLGGRACACACACVRLCVCVCGCDDETFYTHIDLIRRRLPRRRQ